MRRPPYCFFYNQMLPGQRPLESRIFTVEHFTYCDQPAIKVSVESDDPNILRLIRDELETRYQGLRAFCPGEELTA